MKLETDFYKDSQTVRSVSALIRDGRRSAVELIASRLEKTIDNAFLVKSQGKTGSDGITWRPRQDGLLPIGYRTGKLRNALQVTVAHGRDVDFVTATYAHPFAAAFGMFRPLLPHQMPLAWRREAAQPINALATKAANAFT